MVIYGDAHFFIKHKGSFNDTNIWRFSINTGFIKNEFDIPKTQMSPDSVTVSKKFHENFKVTLVWRDYCETWTSKTHISNMCERCIWRTQTAIKEWETINEILETQTPPPSKEVGEKLWFYEDIDYEEVVANKHAVQCDQYKLMRNSTKIVDEIEEGDEEGDEEYEEDHKEENHDLLNNNQEITNPISTSQEENSQGLNNAEEDKEDSNGQRSNADKPNLKPKRDNRLDSFVPNFNNTNELSSSSNSIKSYGSDLDYRKRKEKSITLIQKLQGDSLLMRRMTDPYGKKEIGLSKLNDLTDKLEIKRLKRKLSA